MEIIERHMADAVAKGARVLAGGSRSATAGPRYFEATVLTDVTHKMQVMQEETFGPILPIMRVANEEEAISLANDCDYGLSGTVWTKDPKKADSIARRMHTGSVCVNDSSLTYGIHEAPFGGRKQSGLGAVNGMDALKSYTFAQPVVHDRFGLAREQVWYPYSKETGEQLQKVIHWAFGTRLGRWLT
jgi:acyl-CoA reductase-like NAD-dependent aldehyde dehydrogenase